MLRDAKSACVKVLILVPGDKRATVVNQVGTKLELNTNIGLYFKSVGKWCDTAPTYYRPCSIAHLCRPHWNKNTIETSVFSKFHMLYLLYVTLFIYFSSLEL